MPKTGALSHTSIVAEHGGEGMAPIAYLRVGGSRLSCDELEQHIVDCGRLMEAVYDRWNTFGQDEDRADAGRWRVEMENAIRSRSPATVARLERERGLTRA